MRLLIDTGHPAHVHLFRNLASELTGRGHKVLFTCREKECTVELLKAYGLEFVSFGKPYRGGIGKLWGLVKFNIKMFRVLRRFRPDVTIGHSSMYAAQMSWLLGIPHISLEDTGNMEQIRLYQPFTKTILVPDSFERDLGKKMVRYAGNHELAYLHPARFKIDESGQWAVGSQQLAVGSQQLAVGSRQLAVGSQQSAVSSGQWTVDSDPSVTRHPSRVTRHPSPVTNHSSYIVLRFVAWNASHDRGHKGISEQTKLKAFEAFLTFGHVLISAEGALPASLEAHRLQVPPERFHDVLASAALVWGESATVASEAAVLGVPAVYLDNKGRCYTREEERYGLCFNFTESPEDQLRAIEKGVELLSTPGVRAEWQRRRERFLAGMVDVTGMLVERVMGDG